MTTSLDGFAEVYDTRTGFVSRVPAHFIDDPMVGRFFKTTPAQRFLDGELGDLPTTESTLPAIRDFAAAADIDVTGLRTKDEVLAVVRKALVGEADLPTSPDPNAPAPDSGEGTTDPDATSAADETPAAGDKEN
jgi:hypothetical protein